MLPTTYSVSNYQVEEAHVLNATSYSPSDDYADLIDYILTVDHTDSASSDCELGMTFKPGYNALLTEAKLFINNLIDKTPYVTNLKFQGSTDNWATSTDLYTFDVNVHEGWNYIRFGEDNDVDTYEGPKPSYNSYRFLGAVSGSCRVGEIRLTGVEVIDSDASSVSCTPQVLLNGATTDLTEGDVTYDSTLTPLLTSLSPRFGSVLGSETVAITGTNFPASATPTVTFDSRTCTVTSQSTT